MSYGDDDKRGYLAWKAPPSIVYADFEKWEREKSFREMWGDYYPVITGHVRERIRVKAATT